MFVKHLILITSKIKTRHSTERVSKTKKNTRFSFIDIFQAFDVRLETSRVDCKVLDVLYIRNLFIQSFIYLFIYLMCF